MKRSYRHILWSTAFVSAACTACGPAHDRQGVYTVPRTARVEAKKKEGRRARAPSDDVKVPPARPEPPAGKIDVPVIDPD